MPDSNKMKRAPPCTLSLQRAKEEPSVFRFQAGILCLLMFLEVVPEVEVAADTVPHAGEARNAKVQGNRHILRLYCLDAEFASERIAAEAGCLHVDAIECRLALAVELMLPGCADIGAEHMMSRIAIGGAKAQTVGVHIIELVHIAYIQLDICPLNLCPDVLAVQVKHVLVRYIPLVSQAAMDAVVRCVIVKGGNNTSGIIRYVVAVKGIVEIAHVGRGIGIEMAGTGVLKVHLGQDAAAHVFALAVAIDIGSACKAVVRCIGARSVFKEGSHSQEASSCVETLAKTCNVSIL